eukprot:2517357-Pleurochrysis_carterae.AAC.1
MVFEKPMQMAIIDLSEQVELHAFGTLRDYARSSLGCALTARSGDSTAVRTAIFSIVPQARDQSRAWLGEGESKRLDLGLHVGERAYTASDSGSVDEGVRASHK